MRFVITPPAKLLTVIFLHDCFYLHKSCLCIFLLRDVFYDAHILRHFL